MSIRRQNIFSLISSGKYHSCVMTTFSFDFYFLEMRAVRTLKSLGIKNINILVDGHMYSDLMKDPSGDEMRLATGYSIYPVFEKNIFHPKILMFFGRKQGMLIVGSGNLTGAGNGGNDEIWGAFHFDLENPGNADILSDAWSYISNLVKDVKSMTGQKILEWIPNESGWLKDLPKTNQGEFHKLTDKEEIAFLYNRPESGIWNQMNRLIGEDKIIEITAISPFYDSNGAALTMFKNKFPNAKINAVLQESGQIPSELKNPADFNFYDWRDSGINLKKEFSGFTRLHAKILHLKTEGKTEYLLFGSANITFPGLGLSKDSNEEVSLFLKSDKPELLDDLGITLKDKNRKELSYFNSDRKKYSIANIIKHNQFPIKLFAAELRFADLSLFTTGEYEHEILVRIQDSYGKSIEELRFEKLRPELNAVLENHLEEIHLVTFYDLKENQLSNSILVEKTDITRKTNPNNRNEELEKMVGELKDGDASKIFDLIQLAMNDRESDDKTIPAASGNAKISVVEEQPDVEVTDLAHYNQKVQSGKHEELLSHSYSLQIFDAFKFNFSKAEDYDSELDESDIEINLDTADGGSDMEDSETGTESKKRKNQEKTKFDNKTFQKERGTILRYFDQLKKYQSEHILKKIKNSNEYKLTLTDIARYNIFLILVSEYASKQLELNDKNGIDYFFRWHGGEKEDDVKSFCLSIIADFIRIAGFGFKQYSFKYTNEKVNQLKQDAVIDSIAVILNVRWKDSEKNYPLTMIFNALRYLGYHSQDKFKAEMDELAEKINEKISKFKFILKRKRTEIHWKPDLKNSIFPAYLTSLKDRDSKNYSTDLKKNDIVYWFPAGYCFVKSGSEKNKYIYARPGFLWNDIYKDYCKMYNNSPNTPFSIDKIVKVKI